MTTQSQVVEDERNNYISPIIPTPAVDLAHSVSVNTVPSLHNEYLLSDALYRGYRFEGKMSSVRRVFCLFAMFDVLFIGLMWLICVMLQGESIWQALDTQITHYNIRTSFFDIPFLALCRFILLGFFYGILQINHWIIIFVTTTATSVFCIVKVFYYNWLQTPQPVFEVLSILVSFILAWGEAWFFDYRVIPKESFANQIIVTSTNERSPLIRHYLRGATPSRYTESVEHFQSVINTPEGSLYRFGLEDNAVVGRFPPSASLRNEMATYEMAANDLIQESKEMLRSERWTVEKENDEISAYSMRLPSGHTIFKISAVLNTSPINMLNELFHNVENIPSWNPALLEAQRIEIIDDQTDIIYQLAAGGGGGLVASRDFVSLRHWRQLNDSYIIATKYTHHPNVPKTKFVRGENISCFLLEEGENPNQCKKTFILNTNLKGWIPQKVVNLALVDTLFTYMKCSKVYISNKYASDYREI